jgi:peptidylprolyl isomerase
MPRPLRSSIALVPALIVALLAACGSDNTTTATTAAASSTTSVPSASTSPDKPKVQIPKTLPTELVITDLIEGTGDPAAVGDIVVVNYVGVRSADGTEFDNSYDRGSTFPVTLGENSVIQGWEQGLIGIKSGGRRQLDIPAALAYGDSGSGDVIKPGDALSFVIDAVSVTKHVEVPKANAADKPKVDVAPSIGATKSSFTDLVVGTGDEAVAGSTAYVQLIAYRGDTVVEIQSTWEQGEAATVPVNEPTLPGLVSGITGMKVGGRRELIIVPADAFGDGGSQQLGLPASTDLIMVIDLVAVQPPAP